MNSKVQKPDNHSEKLLAIAREAIQPFLKAHPDIRVFLHGSVVRGDAHKDSDIDITLYRDKEISPRRPITLELKALCPLFDVTYCNQHDLRIKTRDALVVNGTYPRIKLQPKLPV
jgi:predicted nucleotidyltransferase